MGDASHATGVSASATGEAMLILTHGDLRSVLDRGGRDVIVGVHLVDLPVEADVALSRDRQPLSRAVPR
jgi:hypothetical protein